MNDWKHDVRSMVPDVDAVRAAIDEADERARLLRRLLRLTLRLRTAGAGGRGKTAPGTKDAAEGRA